MKKTLLLPLLALAISLQAQNTFTCLVKDSLTGERWEGEQELLFYSSLSFCF